MIPGAFDRADALRRLADTHFDVVVVGGGITGVGCALDAASRGLRTALVERDDFASGTSSKSSKLVHGGLRYLQQGDVRLVYEALAERQRLRLNAPHLVKVLPFLIPVLSKDGVMSRKLARAMGSAMWMYDLTGGAAHRQAPQAHLGRGGPRPLPHPAGRQAAVVVPLLRRPGRRRPALRHHRPHRRAALRRRRGERRRASRA